MRVPSDAPANSYLLYLTLQDENEDSKTIEYKFRVNVQDPIVLIKPVVTIAEDIEVKNFTWTPPSEEELEGKEEPFFKLKSMTYMGLLEVSFSQKMIKPFNTTEIDNSVLELSVVLHDSNDIEDDLSKVAFSWSVESYGEETMTVQIEFESPVYVSTGFLKD